MTRRTVFLAVGLSILCVLGSAGLWVLAAAGPEAAAAVQAPAGADPLGGSAGSWSVFSLETLLAQTGQMPVEPPPTDALAQRRPGRRAQAASAEQIACVLEVAAEIDPGLAARLEQFRDTRPAREFERAILAARHLTALCRLRESDQVLFELKLGELRHEAEVARLAGEFREARRSGSPAVEELQEKLRAQVKLQVSYSVGARGRYLQKLKERVQSFEDELARDAGNVSQTVERRLRELLEEPPATLPPD